MLHGSIAAKMVAGAPCSVEVVRYHPGDEKQPCTPGSAPETEEA